MLLAWLCRFKQTSANSADWILNVKGGTNWQMVGIEEKVSPANTKHLYNTYTMSAQRLQREPKIV